MDPSYSGQVCFPYTEDTDGSNPSGSTARGYSEEFFYTAE